MKKKIKPYLFMLIIVSTEVHSFNILEEMLKEIKEIGQKVDLLNENFKEEMNDVRKNLTLLDFSIETTRDDIKIIKSDMEKIKKLGKKAEENSEILKNEFPAVKENILTIKSNFENIGQQIIKTKSEIRNELNEKEKQMSEEIHRSIERFDNKVQSLNQKIEDNNLKVRSIELKSNTIHENVNDIETLVKTLVFGTVVLSSEGIGAEKQGRKLGQYQYNKLKKHFEQMSTEKDIEQYFPTYLYQTTSMDWWVNDVPGEKTGWLQNKEKTVGPEDVPLSDWLVYADGTWKMDPTLTITSGPLIPSCLTIKIGATGIRSHMLGEYKLSKKWFNGRPIYEKDDGELLYATSGGYWGVSKTLGSYGIRGSPSHHCPTRSKKWEFFDGSDWKIGEITVTCSKYQ